MISTFVSTYFGSPQLGHTLKKITINFQTVDSKICLILIFLEKGLGLASPPDSGYDLLRKIFFMLYSTK